MKTNIKLVLALVLVFSILPLTSALADNMNVYFSDGTAEINATDICVQGGTLCLSTTGSGDITEVNTPDEYLYGGATTGAVNLYLNSTTLNETINALSQDSNQSWNQSLANTLYSSINATGGNESWNESYADTLYILQSDEGNLNVNSSDHWDNLATINASQMEDASGTLNIQESWLTTLWNSIFATKDTDDLTEGSSNLYQNVSFAQNLTDVLYADISVTGGNSSFNQILTDTIYANLNDTNTSWAQTLADTLYSSINATGGNASFNQILTDTMYANLNDTNTSWAQTLADTLYADISVTGDNSSFNQILTDTMYANLNDTNTSWAQTLADTLYADISVTGDNSSFNQILTDTMYGNINLTTDNSSWNEIYADQKYVNLSGDIMTGDLNINANLTAEKLAIGADIDAAYHVLFVENKSGIMTISAHNPSLASGPVIGVIYEVRNAQDHWGAIGMTSNTSTIEGGAFADTYQNYNEGYGNFIFTNDGDVSFKWYSDPTDSHDFSALSNEIMELTARGNLILQNNVTADYFLGNGSLLTGVGFDNESWNEALASTLFVNLSGDIMTGDLSTSGTFNGAFNWTSSDDYNIFNGSTLKFNESKLVTTYFNATSIVTIRGTALGALEDIHDYGGNSYNVTEETGAVGLDVRVNFTGVDAPNQAIVRYKNTAGESHTSQFYIWDYDDADWELYASEGEVGDWTVFEFGIFDVDAHTSGEIIQFRFLSSANGNTGHTHYFDWVTAAKGLATPSGTEIDPLSFHKSRSIDNTGYNITAALYFGNGSYMIGVNESWTQVWADTQYADISVTGDNSSFNQILTDTMYANLNDTNTSWTQAYGNTLYSNINDSGNSSFNQILTDTMYANLNDTNTSWTQDYANNLYPSINDTNTSWTQAYANNLYASINITGGNESWNESYANGLYYGAGNPSEFYNSSDFSIGDYVPYTGADTNLDLGNNNLSVGTNDFFVDESASNVGIGTTSPTSTLSFGAGSTISTATSDGADNDMLTITGGGASGVARGGRIQLTGNENSTNPGQVIIEAGDVANGDITFKVNGGVTVMNINQEFVEANTLMLDKGNVGIGTASPTQRLDVSQGNIALGYNVAESSLLYKTFATAHASGNAPSQLSMILDDGAPSGVRIKNTDLGTFNAQSIHFDVHQGGVSQIVDAMVINYDGNIGIGTTVPSVKLEVNGSINISGTGSHLVFPDGTNQTTAYNQSWTQVLADTQYRIATWDNFTGIPTATPSNGDITHLSTADQIYDWVSSNFLAAMDYTNLALTNVTNTFSQPQTFQSNITTEEIVFETAVTNSIRDNATCLILGGSTSRFEIC